MTGNISRVDYSRLTQRQASAAYRRRQHIMRLHYSAKSEHVSIDEELFNALDEIDDEALIRYLSMRAERRKKKGYSGSLGPDSKELAKASIGNNHTARTGSNDPDRYFRALSDKALHYCKKELQAGRSVDYKQVLNRFRCGVLK